MPVATLTFFGLLLLVFAGQLFLLPGTFFVPAGLAFVPGELFGGVERAGVLLAIPPPATLISYQFLHAGWLHLLGNLLFPLVAFAGLFFLFRRGGAGGAGGGGGPLGGALS